MVVNRAWKVLEELETSGAGTNQPSLFDSKLNEEKQTLEAEETIELSAEVLPTMLGMAMGQVLTTQLKEIDLNQMTPMAAMNWIAEQQQKLKA